MERWLLISNCQTFGLTNSFMMLNPNFSVEGVDVWSYSRNIEEYNAKMGDYFRVVIHPDILHIPGNDFSFAKNVSIIPSVNFSAYHPDICSIRRDGNVLSGSMGQYHSIIAVAAFNAGLSLADARSLYCVSTYEVAGYMGRWVADRDSLVAHFRHYNLDISHSFQRWSRGRAFMYSINHARIEVIYDIAKLFMQSCGVPIFETDVLPSDNLVMGPCFPVYNEIAENLGVRGSYLFKPLNAHHYETLDQFLAKSYDVFSQDGGALELDANGAPQYDRIQALIRGEA